MISLIYICPYSLPQIPRSSALRYSPPTVRLFSILCTSNNLPKGLLFSILSYRETFQYIPKVGTSSDSHYRVFIDLVLRAISPGLYIFLLRPCQKLLFPRESFFFPFSFTPHPPPPTPLEPYFTVDHTRDSSPDHHFIRSSKLP